MRSIPRYPPLLAADALLRAVPTGRDASDTLIQAEALALVLLEQGGPRARRAAREYVHEGQQAMVLVLQRWLASAEARTDPRRSTLRRCLRELEAGLKASEARSSAPADPLLSTSDAASLLGCSRPHVAMLIDSGTLSGERTAGNHRRVRQSEVLAYQERSRQLPSVGYRQAAADAGLYTIADDVYEAALRGEPPAPMKVAERRVRYGAKRKK